MKKHLKILKLGIKNLLFKYIFINVFSWVKKKELLSKNSKEKLK